MEINAFPASEILITSNRQRRVFSEESIVELAESIADLGLIHPPVVRMENGKCYLVAGERRLKAISFVWMLGKQIRVGSQHYTEGIVPCILHSDLSPLDAFAIELDENIKREDLSIIDRATAISKLFELRSLQAEAAGVPKPTTESIAREVFNPSPGAPAHSERIHQSLMVARNAHVPEVKKAKTLTEAVKIIRRNEELARSKALGIEVGKTFSSSLHLLKNENCLDWLSSCLPEIFDVVLTDPPYGMEAQEFSDSGGKAQGSHFYDDSYKSWRELMHQLFPLLVKAMKPNAHLYMFCDIDRFAQLKDMAYSAGLKPFRTPLIWVNPTANRVPWITSGPQRKWQAILYCIKGSKSVNHIRPDVLTYLSDPNLNHQAQKPVGLYEDLLSRSCSPGDLVLDPFCGTGTIFPAAHALKLRASGIEMDPSAYGIALKRLQELK